GQVEAQLQVVQKLEEKERGLQSALGAVEKELSLRSQALELHKRKAVEAAQLAEDLRAQGEHVQARLRELQVCAAENRAAKDKESLSLKRAQEELSRLRRKLEKQRKVEVYADADQILQEEIKEYRVSLPGPSGTFWNFLGPSGISGTFQNLRGASRRFQNLPGTFGTFRDFLGASWSFQNFLEELSRLRRKLEKQRKVEVYADADQILQEEIKEYR
ncbi:E3 ubiquitin-protein ligase BRE1B-like, partial [Passer montanus]|uniref:E3 ubiquitin-protein ligase BRE1B-like n=1 Tax=Passer montanus TaxID=9160 RepID=UPI0019618BA6